MAEFYFDYTVKLLKNDLNLSTDKSGMPKVYFERDYSTENVHYVMYVTFPQWNANNRPKNTRTALGFTKAKIFYDIGAIGVDTVVNVSDKRQARANNVEVSKEITFEEYASEGHRCVIVNDEDNCSGVGKIILQQGDKETVYFFAVNFEFKKKIRYSIIGNTIHIEPNSFSKKFKIIISSSGDRGAAIYPCLKDKIRESLGQSHMIELDTDNKPISRDIPESLRDKPLYLSFDPKDEEASKHYLLECVENSTLGIKEMDFARQHEKSFCPYCHKVFASKVDIISKTKHGGTSCTGERFSTEDKKVMMVMDGKNRKKVAKQAFYCSDDFTMVKDEYLKMPDDAGDLLRTLPETFFEHNHFKIIVMGSKRAGKTTFISRLFGIKGNGQDTELLTDTIKHATRKVANLSAYSINCLKVVDEIGGKKILTTKDSWYKKNDSFYSAYSIDINRGLYPGATNTVGNARDVDKLRNITKAPFVMEVNKSSYVYFYDMAGEDAQRSTEFISTLIGKPEENQPVAIFCLIDSRADTSDTLSVFQRINEVLAGRKSVCPVAVILTKFDTIEKEFDDNCYCLRSDSYDMMTNSYEGSELEKSVNFSSEEIRSYLSSKKINPDFGGLANVKYFGVSAFSTPDSIFHEDQKGKVEEVNYLLHSSSPKRMELPLIWTLKQFGCII